MAGDGIDVTLGVGQGEAGPERLAADGGSLVAAERAAVEVAAAVGEGLAVGYCDGAAVAAGGDAVGGVGPADGDGAVGGEDAEVSASSVDNAAVDGDVAACAMQTVRVGVGCDGSAVDGDSITCVEGSLLVARDIERAAIDSEVITGVDTESVIAVVSDGDVTAIQREVAGDDDAAVVGDSVAGAIHIKVSAAEALSVDGEGVTAAGGANADAANPALALAHVHRTAVGKYEGHIAAEVERVVEGDGGQSYEVPPCGEAGLGAVEGYGLGGLCGAVGIDVGDTVLLAVAAEGTEANGDVGVGHGQGATVGEGDAVVVAGRVVDVAVAEGGTGGVAEGEGHGVTLAVVEGLAALDAVLVGGDAAEGVGGGGLTYGADGDGDILSGGTDGAGGDALRVAEDAGVVAVGAYRAVAHKGGTGANLGLVLGKGGGGVERVGDGGGGVIALVSYQSAAAVGGSLAIGEQFAVKEASLYGEAGGAAVANVADDAAVGAVAAGEAVDDGADVAVADGDRAVLGADEASGILLRGVDVAADVQVLNHATRLDIAEGRGLVLVDGAAGRAIVDGQRVPPAVKRAGEVVVRAARHAADGDVSAEHDGLVGEEALGVLVQQVAEDVPAPGGVDGVGVARLGEVGGINGDGQSLTGDGGILRVGQCTVVGVCVGAVAVNVAVWQGDGDGAVVAAGAAVGCNGAAAERDGFS